jgi:hypothetical protein
VALPDSVARAAPIIAAMESIKADYGAEKNPTTIRLAKMNLAVHGLDGNIQKAISYYGVYRHVFWAYPKLPSPVYG